MITFNLIASLKSPTYTCPPPPPRSPPRISYTTLHTYILHLSVVICFKHILHRARPTNLPPGRRAEKKGGERPKEDKAKTTNEMPYQDRSARRGQSGNYSPTSSGAATPTHPSAGSSAFLSNSISGLASGFGGLVRRLSDMTTAQPGYHPNNNNSHRDPSQSSSSYYSSSHVGGRSSPLSHPHNHRNNGISGVYTPPIHRSASPMRPPPLEPLELKGFREDTAERARLLTPAVAEEIRIMVPERQRIEDEWNLVYSLDQDGASLGTLYKKCSTYEGTRASFVLVVRDNDGGVSYNPSRSEP